VCRGHLLQWEGRRYARSQPAGVGERGRGVECAVHPCGYHPAYRFPERCGASDELLGTEPADQLLVAGSGDGDRPEPA
jgi:hypothetical protein